MTHEPQEISDADRVMHAAGLLDLSEFEVFERAHREWYGREGDLRALEHEFLQYLHVGTAPPWVRHFTRAVFRRHHDRGPAGKRAAGASAALLRLVDSRLGRFLLS